MVTGSRDIGELEKQELLAKTAFDKVDPDGNGYILNGELHGLADSLGLPIAPDEQDEALEELDRDNDGVFDREKWTKWWVQRWEAHPIRGDGLSEEDGGRGAVTAGQIDGEGEKESGGGGGERISELTERAKQARRRAGTDIHTAAWRGDLALVKGFLEDDPELANAVDVSEFGTGYRPLHYAAYGGFLDVCEALHAAGARALAAGDNGVTALFLAAQAGKADVVRFLLGLGADPTAQERGSGLCAMDVVDESCPDIFRQMQEKGGFQPPAPLEIPPMVTRVGPASLQVAFLPLPETKGALPVSRYKVKVEHDGAPGETGFDKAAATTTTTTAPDTDEPSAADAAIGGGGGGGGVKAAGDVAAAGDSGFANSTLAQVVLVPAREVSTRPALGDVLAGGEEQQQGQRRTFVTVRGLKSRTRYRIQVAAVNAIGFGPYGPASAAVATSSKAEEEDDGSVAKGTASSARGSHRAARNEKEGTRNGKGKGRQVLAMERRRSLAAQAARLQEQQQREAEERQARRAQKHAQRAGPRASGRPLAATTGGTGQRVGSGDGALGASEKGKMQHRPRLGGANQTQPLRHRERRQDRNEVVDGTCRSAAHRETNTRTTPTSPRRSAPSPAAGGLAIHQGREAHHHRHQPRPHRTQGSRPATTGASGHGSHAADDDGDDNYDGTAYLSGSGARARSARRLVATAPAVAVAAAETAEAATTEAGEEPRYSAARIAGYMSARAYYPRRKNGHNGDNISNSRRSSREQPPSAFVEEGRAATVHPGGSQPKGAGALPGGSGQRQRRRRRPGRVGGGDIEGRRGSSSDVSVSSCGDMTISSEEQEREEMAYTG